MVGNAGQDSKGDTRAAARLYSVPEQTLQHEHSHLGEVATQALRPDDTLCPYIMMRSGRTPYRGQPDFWTSPQCTSGAREWLKLVVETSSNPNGAAALGDTPKPAPTLCKMLSSHSLQCPHCSDTIPWSHHAAGSYAGVKLRLR